VESYLSVVRYFFGMGGMLLLLIAALMVCFVMHIRSYNTNDRWYEPIATFYIGAMLGLTVIFISFPTLCFIRSTLVCYRVM
jgi:membrane-anchored protein YejM (alkaline phosphatase superfamily)